MFKKLDFILQKYDELSVTVSDPTVIADQARWQKHIKEMGEMEPIVLKYREYKKAQEEKEQTLEMLGDSSLDEDMRDMAKEELSELNDKLASCDYHNKACDYKYCTLLVGVYSDTGHILQSTILFFHEYPGNI